MIAHGFEPRHFQLPFEISKHVVLITPTACHTATLHWLGLPCTGKMMDSLSVKSALLRLSGVCTRVHASLVSEMDDWGPFVTLKMRVLIYTSSGKLKVSGPARTVYRVSE